MGQEKIRVRRRLSKRVSQLACMIGLDISHLNISENGPTKSDFFCKMLEIKNAHRPKMKMANPKKFSEKIALHKQRQAEEQG